MISVHNSYVAELGLQLVTCESAVSALLTALWGQAKSHLDHYIKQNFMENKEKTDQEELHKIYLVMCPIKALTALVDRLSERRLGKWSWTGT